MKVLIVINGLGTGGAEKLLADTIPIFIKRGLEVELLLLNGKNHPFLIDLINKDCCKIHVLGEGSVYNPFLIIKLISFLKKYDIVHVHLFPSLYWVAISKWISFSKTILIYTEHNTTNKRRDNYFFNYLDKFVYRFYSIIISISNKVESNLKEYLGDKYNDKFHLINNGINLETYNKIQPSNKNKFNFLNSEDKLLIQVSRFQKQKDQPTLIQALKLLPNEVKLILVGEGELRRDCETLVENLNLQNRVIFLGIRMDVPDLLNTSDIVVLSSKYEGLSLSSVEGLASAKPFIASDVPGLTEVVQGAGLLFPQGDSVALANHITSLLNNPEYYKRVASACLERSKQYDINIMVDKHIELYKSLM